MKTAIVAAAAAASLLGASLAAATAVAWTAPLVDVRVIDRSTGQPAPLHPFQGRFFVEGNAGNRYAVRIVNRTGQRVLAVLSVDGINAVTGETAGTDQNGYVLGPYQSYDVTGWRKSKDEVAAFYFTSLPDSYAARTDRPGNVGVIGVAAWRERTITPPPGVLVPRARDEDARRQPPSAAEAANAASEAATTRKSEAGAAADLMTQPASPAQPAQAAPPVSSPRPSASLSNTPEREKLGTGHGEREGSRVEFVNFERDGVQPTQLVQIFYDSRSNLIARGVIRSGTASNAEPDPFPIHRFVPDPRS